MYFFAFWVALQTLFCSLPIFFFKIIFFKLQYPKFGKVISRQQKLSQAGKVLRVQMSAARHPKRELDSTFKAASKFKSFFSQKKVLTIGLLPFFWFSILCLERLFSLIFLDLARWHQLSLLKFIVNMIFKKFPHLVFKNKLHLSTVLIIKTKKSEYDQEIPQSHTVDQPMVPLGRDTGH